MFVSFQHRRASIIRRVTRSTVKRKQRSFIHGVIVLIILLFVYSIFITIVRLKKQNRLKPTVDHSKKNVYKLCQSFLQRNDPLRILSQNHSSINIAEDMATSYLLRQNLQKLSRKQQNRTHVIIFLNEISNNVTYIRLVQWFTTIYKSCTARVDVIRIKNDNRSSRERMINYMKSNKKIHFETILFFLEDDYIFDTMMLSETIEFFTTHDPCFIIQIDHSDRCRLIADDGFEHIVVPGRTRLWRSIPFNLLPFACRWKTFLTFVDLIKNTNNVGQINKKIRALVNGVEIFYCPIPSYSAQIETLLLPDDINITNIDNMATYYKDWWSMARYALAKAQKLNLFPYSKINEQTLFA